jgi:hypothetical protein
VGYIAALPEKSNLSLKQQTVSGNQRWWKYIGATQDYLAQSGINQIIYQIAKHLGVSQWQILWDKSTSRMVPVRDWTCSRIHKNCWTCSWHTKTRSSNKYEDTKPQTLHHGAAHLLLGKVETWTVQRHGSKWKSFKGQRESLDHSGPH